MGSRPFWNVSFYDGVSCVKVPAILACTVYPICSILPWIRKVVFHGDCSFHFRVSNCHPPLSETSSNAVCSRKYTADISCGDDVIGQPRHRRDSRSPSSDDTSLPLCPLLRGPSSGQRSYRTPSLRIELIWTQLLSFWNVRGFHKSKSLQLLGFVLRCNHWQ